MLIISNLSWKKPWHCLAEVLFAVLLVATLFLPNLSTATDEKISDHYQEGRFFNPSGVEATYDRMGSIIKRSLFEDRVSRPSGPIPVKQLSLIDKNSDEQAAVVSEVVLYRLGHSTVLIQINGEFWLTDPVFSNRASFVQWFGPSRYHEPPISIEELPNIKGVLISHDHYDHLDKASIEQLHSRVEHFYVPLGVDTYLQDWDVPEHKITALDWWESSESGDVTLVATPAQHFSGRGLFGRDKTLWASWVLMTKDVRIFFSGDSGYFDGFKAIGDKYGPFDVTLIETGAYDRDWPEIHMFPEESIQANMDLGGELYMPIHNSTFELALHDWNEPLIKVSELASNISFAMPMMGEAVPLANPPEIIMWWGDETTESDSELTISHDQ